METVIRLLILAIHCWQWFWMGAFALSLVSILVSGLVLLCGKGR
jgi:hypothetical protein